MSHNADDPTFDVDAEAAPGLVPPCRHLRSKGMYVYNDASGVEAHGEYDNSIFWCLQTMKSFGPDDGMVGRVDCCNSGRSCYEPL